LDLSSIGPPIIMVKKPEENELFRLTIFP
jgi:hypothetical protein